MSPESFRKLVVIKLLRVHSPFFVSVECLRRKPLTLDVINQFLRFPSSILIHKFSSSIFKAEEEKNFIAQIYPRRKPSHDDAFKKMGSLRHLGWRREISIEEAGNF